MIPIILIDLRVGFERTLYSVSESAGELEIPVRVLADENGITTEVGLYTTWYEGHKQGWLSSRYGSTV